MEGLPNRIKPKVILKYFKKYFLLVANKQVG